MSEYDRVYNEHCCKCHLRHEANCAYKNCSKEQYDQWLKEAKQKAFEEKYGQNK